MKRLTAILALILACIGLPPLASAQEADAAPESGAQEPAADPTWSSELGLSYLATSGNSETESLGVGLQMVRPPTPWGLEITASFDRAEEAGVKTAERAYAGLRGTRALTPRWNAFAGLSLEQDEFSGIDLRGIVEAGAAYKALLGPRHFLAVDLALTWTDEDRLAPALDDSSLGGLAGLEYKLAFSETATFTQAVRYFANFDDSDNWRADALTAVTASLNERLALRLSYEIRYRNQPIGLNEDTDTTTKISLVWKG